MANSDVTLQNKDELDIYPITRERNVYDENNVNLKEKFKTVVFKDNEVHKFAQELYEESANLFNENEFTNEYITYDGYTGDSTTSILSHYIKVNPNTKYTFSSSNSSSMDRGYCFYDKTKKVIPGALWNSINKTVTTPSNAEYIRVSFPLGYTSMVNEGETALPYNPYNPNRHITNSEAEFLKEEFGKSSNKFNLDKSSSVNGQAYITDGSIVYWNGYCRFADYIEVKENTTYVLAINEQTNIYSTIVLYDANKTVIGYKTTNKFTALANTKYIRFACQKLREEITTVMLNEGNIELPYQPYNSASHITNPQADLLKSEWEKSYNLLGYGDIPETTTNGVTYKVENGVFTLNGIGTAYTSITLKLNADIDGGEYSFLAYKTGSLTGGYSHFGLSKSNGTVLASFNTAGKDQSDITTTEKSTYLYLDFNAGATFTNYQLKPMIIKSKGHTVNTISYQRWNGSIIHEKDIKPAVLWESGSPNAEYSATSQAINDSSLYKYILIGYKDWHASTDGVKIMKFENVVGKRFYLDYVEVTSSKAYVKSRRVTIESNTKINFETGNAYELVSNTYDSNHDGQCTPVFVLGSNY